MKVSFWKFAKLFFLLFIFASLILTKTAFAAQVTQQKETRAEELLAQADLFFQKGEYKKAADSYLEAASVETKKTNLSRAYFGLSLSYFYLQDITNTKKWMRKVLEVDPEKQISVLFHPENFVQLFSQVQKETKQGQATEEPKKLSLPKETVPPSKKDESSSSTFSRIKNSILGDEEWAGKWEIEVHYSGWGLNLMKGLFEDYVTKKLGQEIRNELTDQVRESHQSLNKSSYEQGLAFDSGGSNYGFEIRFYPKGLEGSFSLGFSFEKTKIRLSVSGPVKQTFSDGSYAAADSKAFLETRPFSTNLSFRWDLKPSWRFSPYFIVGLGLASLNGEVGFNYSGSYQWGGSLENVEKEEIKSFIQAEEEGDFNLPNIFILLQASFGVRGEIYEGIFARVEAGFWDGFSLRCGLAYRF